MIFKGRLLTSDSTLNKYEYLDSLSVISESPITLKFQIFQDQRSQRYVPVLGATIAIIFNKNDDTTFSVAGTLDTSDRSLVTVELSAVQTLSIVGGNITFELTESAVVSKGYMQNIISKIVTGF